MNPVQSTSSNEPGPAGNPPDFSLVLGGPLFQLLRRAHLSDETMAMLRRRVVVISMLAWLPLLLLSALQGRLVDGSVAVPFLFDVEVHVRYLVALPLLIVAELVVHRRLQPLLQQFQERNLVPDADMPRFEAAVAAAYRLRNSVLAEVLLIVFVYGFGILVVWRQYAALATTTWYATPAIDGYVLSLAGMWYVFVSLPIFQFLLCRWYFRLFIWARFLWQVSRIELALVPTHPDRVGGLGFLGSTAYAFAVLAVAHGALLAGLLANRIFFLGASLTQFKIEIAVVVGIRARSAPLSAAGVRLPAGRREAKRAARVRDAGRAIRARVRRQVGAWQSTTRASRWSAAPTFNRLPTWGTATRSCGRCAFRRSRGTPSCALAPRRWFRWSRCSLPSCRSKS